MKKILNIISGMFVGTLLFGSCADDLEVRDGLSGVDDNVIRIQMLLPEETHIVTRAEYQTGSEKSVSNAYAIFFEKNATDNFECLDVIPATVSTANSILTINKSVAVRQARDHDIYVVANAGTSLTNAVTAGMKLSDFKKATTSAGFFVMSGKASGESGSYTVELQRVSAKATVKKSETFTGNVPFEIVDFFIYNTPASAYILAPLKGDDKYLTGTTDRSSSVSEGVPTAYTYPVKSLGSSETGTGSCIVLQAKYNNETCFYRVDLRNEKQGDNYTYYDFEPNHWYDVQITSASAKGFKDAASAARRPMEGITAEIHDHMSNIFTMISDGKRELGLQDYIEIKAAPEVTYFSVRFYSPDSSDMEDTPVITIDQEVNWLSYDETPLDDNAVSGNHTSDPATGGKTIKFKLLNSYPFTLGELTATIKVTWCGMERSGKVTWKQDFDASSVGRFMLTIQNAHTKYTTIQDYFKFLKGETTSVYHANSETCNNPKLYGVDETAMGPGNARNKGFHLPMPKGPISSLSSGTVPSYTYHIYLDEEKFPDYTVESIEVEGFNKEKYLWVPQGTPQNRGISFFASQMFDSSGNYAYDPNDFTYFTGKLFINISYKPDGQVRTLRIPFEVYRCGFFDEIDPNTSSNAYRKDPVTSDTYGYYYYEVVQIHNKRWLDRNLGAKARGMYIQGSNGSSIIPAQTWPYIDSSAGGYFMPAKYYSTPSGGHDAYDNPEENLYKDLCPTGYRLPRKGEWDDLREAHGFTTELYRSQSTGVSYYTAYYDSATPGAGRIYFPKSRYYNGSDLMGEAGTGYYWTASRASGTEKEEIGRWLRVLTMSGASTGYVFGDISNFGMSVRCIVDDGTTKDPEHTISFNVKGVTNVLIYRRYQTINGGAYERDPLMDWPGKGVCEAVTARNNQTVQFSFNTSFNPKTDDLYVIFTVVENGITKVVCSDGNGGLASPSTSLKNARGWKVSVGANYNFTNNNGTVTKDSGWSSTLTEDK